jgi:surface protein
MSNMFRYASSFNQDLGAWNVSNVTNMMYMFRGTAFNQDISNWDVSSVTDMTGMFMEAKSFNQNIGNWNVSNVTNMSNMFNRTAFNQNIGSWDVSKVTDMTSMFYGDAAFNQNIGNWNVSNVILMWFMFENAYLFNQDISTWDVSSVTQMKNMFRNASSFNQDLGAWKVISVYNMYCMFENVTLSTINYDNILIGWAEQAVRNDVWFHGGNSKYSLGAAATARAKLTGTYHWQITDGGQSSGLTVSTLSISDITSTSASSGGNITNEGGSPVTARGVVWGTSENPTIDANTGITSDGIGMGSFTSSITGLTENTTFHVRAYASNANGTAYGENRTFVAKKIKLTLTGTFSVINKTYDGNTVATINTNNLSLNGFVAGATNVSIGTISLAFNNKDVADNKIVSITNIELLGSDALVYHLELASAPTSSANIAAMELTIAGNFTVANKAYDGTTATTITENNLTLTTPAVGDDVSLTNVVAAFESENTGKNIAISITTAKLDGLDKGNYTLSLAGAPTTTATISTETTTFTVTFTVIYNSNLLKDAAISINEQTLTTNVDGIATIELGNGVYPYTVSISGYKAYEGSITVNGTAVNEEIALIKVGVTMNLLSNNKVYPNPFQNTINISNAGNIERIIMKNIVGEVLMSIDLNQVANYAIETNLPSGIYLLSIIGTDGSKEERKIIRN